MPENKEIQSGVVVKQPQQSPSQHIPNNGISSQMIQDGAVTESKIDIAVKPAFADYTSDRIKNYIINGNFRLWQRRDSPLTGLGSSQTYHADRFAWAAGTITAVVTSTKGQPSDFSNSAIIPRSCPFIQRYDVTTAQAVLSAGSSAGPWHKLEGFDFDEMLANGALERGATLSFYVAASVVGTYTIELFNNAIDNRFFTTFTINAVDTWQRVSIYLSPSVLATGIASGSWNYTNLTGLAVRFWIASGTTAQGGTQNAWTGATPNVAITQANLLSTVGNRFGLTGLMLNVGNITPAFRTRGSSFNEELTLARRFYEKTYDVSIDVGGLTTNGQLRGYGPVAYGSQPNIVRVNNAPNPWRVWHVGTNNIAAGPTVQVDGSGRTNDGSVQTTLDPQGSLYADMQVTAAFNVWIQYIYKVTKRITPTVTVYNPNTGLTGTMYDASGNVAASTDSGNAESVYITNTAAARAGTAYAVHLTADAEL